MANNWDIQKVFTLFKAKQFEEAQEINNKILESDPTNIYAQKYAKIISLELSKKISNDSTSWNKESVQKVRWKSLKCPHCESKIPVSWMTQDQIASIKKGDYNNLSIKCNYCHIDFVLQKRKAKSILWIKLWNKANIAWKQYKVVWYVEYEGIWYEGRYSWRTVYLEWILLWEDNSYAYFSEWKSWDDGRPEVEFELSQKIIPQFSFSPNYSSKQISIDGSNVAFSGITKSSVKSVYWENSKSYTVGEKNELYEFPHWWKSYVIEKEWAWNQTEAWIYQTKELTWNTAATMFGKKYSAATVWNKSSSNSIGSVLRVIIFWIAFLWPFMSLFSTVGSIGNPFNALFEDKKEIPIEKITQWQKFELTYPNSNIIPKTTSQKRYDYGGVRTTTKSYTWLKFSIESEADEEVLRKIQELRDNDWSIITSKNMFEWKIYQLK